MIRGYGILRFGMLAIVLGSVPAGAQEVRQVPALPAVVVPPPVVVVAPKPDVPPPENAIQMPMPVKDVGASADAGKPVAKPGKVARRAPRQVRRHRQPMRPVLGHVWPGPSVAYEVTPWSDGVTTSSAWCFGVDFHGQGRWVRCRS